MKERPIPFSAPMVRAILDGTKTQTRRVVKPTSGPHTVEQVIATPDSLAAFVRSRCPYGEPGDRLWVREAWKAHTTFDDLPPRDIPESHVWYMADDGYKAESRYRQGMFMPRWASRITLEVTGVRVERLQAISRGDSMSEGCPFPNMAKGDDPRQWYASLWESINGSWDANPWVWVIEFRRMTPTNSADPHGTTDCRFTGDTRDERHTTHHAR